MNELQRIFTTQSCDSVMEETDKPSLTRHTFHK